MMTMIVMTMIITTMIMRVQQSINVVRRTLVPGPRSLEFGFSARLTCF